jgi:hypothetical protein
MRGMKMRLGGSVEIEIEVKVSDLINALKINRDKHVEEYAEAVKNYMSELTTRLKVLTKSVKNNEFRSDRYQITLAPPVDAKKMYDQYINMLSMSQKDTMNISTHEYQCFVEDEWDWAKAAKVTNSFYSSSNTKAF